MHIIVNKLNHADIAPIKGGYRLNESWIAKLTLNGSKEFFLIEEGFTHDGASVPRGFRWLIERDGIHRESALLHDYLYENKGFGSLTRKDCDQIFRECLKFQQLPKWKRILMYVAVRSGGKLYW